MLDPDGAPTGEVKPRDAVHRDGDWHRTAHLWVLAGDGVLLQRRSAHKAAWPGMLDATAAGHVAAGEDVLQAALREAAEELGVAWGPDDVRAIGTYPIEDRPRAGMINREHALVLVVRDDRPLATWAPGLDRDELDGLVLLGLDAFARLVHAGDPQPARAVDLDGRVGEVRIDRDEVLRPPYLPTLLDALRTP